MDHTGKRFGLAAGACIGLAVAGVVAFGVGIEGHETFVAASGAGFAASLMALGWFVGRHYDRLRARSERDSLTGLFNRGFMERCYRRLSEQALRANKKMSVTIVDVNDFKEINDTYGHRTGDRVLALLAEALKLCSDRGEIVGRWGGDEFLLLSPYVERGTDNALHRNIEEQMERLSQKENKRISVALGTAIFPEEGSSLDQLLQAADRNMYADKNVRKKDEALKRLNA